MPAPLGDPCCEKFVCVEGPAGEYRTHTYFTIFSVAMGGRAVQMDGGYVWAGIIRNRRETGMPNKGDLYTKVTFCCG